MIQQLRKQLGKVISRDTTVRDFEDWFLPATWDLSEKADPTAFALVADVRLALAEFDRGDLTENELLDKLAKLTSPVPSP